MIVQPSSPEAAAQRFASLFPEIYLRFHRRDEKRSELSGASRAVLTHLAMTGPLTVGEAAGHLQRAQSVVSEIVTQLAGKGLLERWRDPRDRRRTLVWLTPSGLRFLERDRDVLSVELLAAAFAEMTASEQEALARGVDALLRSNPELPDRAIPTHRRPRPDPPPQPSDQPQENQQ
ncbi:MAG TPA: MarR family winged helix-turn-helix transcriptional regulator [Kineosporiaceae bacterium]|nr:MarR family winged helix-turn-helix transcriptional regulator [Kineosporiaceae bacterium]